eukprot:Awhi_evm2s14436
MNPMNAMPGPMPGSGLPGVGGGQTPLSRPRVLYHPDKRPPKSGELYNPDAPRMASPGPNNNNNNNNGGVMLQGWPLLELIITTIPVMSNSDLFMMGNMAINNNINSNGHGNPAMNMNISNTNNNNSGNMNVNMRGNPGYVPNSGSMESWSDPFLPNNFRQQPGYNDTNSNSNNNNAMPYPQGNGMHIGNNGGNGPMNYAYAQQQHAPLPSHPKQQLLHQQQQQQRPNSASPHSSPSRTPPLQM